jgi:hypothetical protein
MKFRKDIAAVTSGDHSEESVAIETTPSGSERDDRSRQTGSLVSTRQNAGEEANYEMFSAENR